MRNWAGKVTDLSNIGRLIHLAARMDSVDVERIRGQLLGARRRAYEHELTLQAQRVGCNGRQGRLSEGPTLTAFNDESKRDAESIVNTYNYDLAIAIQAIRSETPTANRHVYAKRLGEWDSARAEAKAAQVAQWTEGQARDRAIIDFMQNNGIVDKGFVTIEPEIAAEAVCRGLVNRGPIPMREAMGISVPVHIGCPHFKQTHPEAMPRGECGSLWVGT